MSEEPVRENRRYFLNSGTNTIESEPLSQSQVDALREEVLSKGLSPALRSCWRCNSCHGRFLTDTSDDFFFVCLQCGAYFFNGNDLSDYSEPSRPASSRVLN